jgi:hypothetical protein
MSLLALRREGLLQGAMVECFEEESIMPTQLTELEAFYVYLGGVLKRGKCTVAPEALYEQWCAERGFEKASNEVQLIVADMQASRGITTDEAFALFREKQGLPALN